MTWIVGLSKGIMTDMKASLRIIISPADSTSIMTLLRQSILLEELTSVQSINILRMRLIPVLEHTQTLINMLNPKV